MGRCSSALVEDGGSGKSPVGSSFGTLYMSLGGEEDKRGPFLIIYCHGSLPSMGPSSG